MIPNCSTTLYNKYVDPSTRTEQYQGTIVLNMVQWGPRGITQSKDGQMLDNIKHFQLQQSRAIGYLEPVAWQALSSGQRPAYWTIQPGDYIVIGAVADVINSGFTIGNLKAKYNDVLVILNVELMLQGSLSSRHFEIEAK